MHLLVCTQKMDYNDPGLGFFHAWIEAFSSYWDKITVVCLEKGRVSLPGNVTVLSLGKEEGKSRFVYLLRFFAYVIDRRKEYDSVFVHMNQEYVFFGGLLWRLWGKEIGLWYNHTNGSLLTRLAGYVAHVIFHTSPFAYTASFKNAHSMPAGIDTGKFKKQNTGINSVAENKKMHVLYVGRIAPLKGVHTLLEAIRLLRRRGGNVTLDVYGDALLRDRHYDEMIRAESKDLQEEGRVQFFEGVPNDKTPRIYSDHDVFVNLTPSGNYDKTVLEAAACECLVVVSSPAFQDMVPSELYFTENDAESLAQTLERVSSLSPRERLERASAMREYVIANHDLAKLARNLPLVYKGEA